MRVEFATTSNSRRTLIMAAALSTIAAGAAAGQDFAQPIPKVYKDGPSLRFEFSDMQVGIAEYDEGPTGTTVFYVPNGVKGAVDVRGGAPGTMNAAVLMNSYESKMIQAVVFSGGSWYGLSAATGVANGIKELKLEEGNVDFIAGVVGAIIYDVGGRRYSRITPDDRLGKAALLSAATGSFPLGARGPNREYHTDACCYEPETPLLGASAPGGSGTWVNEPRDPAVRNRGRRRCPLRRDDG